MEWLRQNFAHLAVWASFAFAALAVLAAAGVWWLGRGQRFLIGWLEIESFRPFTLVIDRNGVLRDYFFGSQELDTFEVKIREYL